MSLRCRNFIPATLILAGFAACLVGLIVHRMDRVLPWARFSDTLVLAIVSILCAWPLRRFARWPWAIALAAPWLIAVVTFSGFRPAIAAALVATAAISLGTLIVPRETPARITLALAGGLALMAGIDGWLLSFPIHHAFVYAPVLLAICALRRRELIDVCSDASRSLLAAVEATPLLASIAVLVLGIASMGAWLPTVQSDDLVYHLALPSQLLAHGVYLPDPHHQIWALAPWSADVLQGIAEVLAGGESRGAIDALWLFTAAAALWSLARAFGADVRVGWATVAMFASLPLTAALATSMLTELPAVALTASLAVAIALGRGGVLMALGGVLAGGLAGLKFAQLFAAMVLCIWALARARGSIEWKRMPLATLFSPLPAHRVMRGRRSRAAIRFCRCSTTFSDRTFSRRLRSTIRAGTPVSAQACPGRSRSTRRGIWKRATAVSASCSSRSSERGCSHCFVPGCAARWSRQRSFFWGR